MNLFLIETRRGRPGLAALVATAVLLAALVAAPVEAIGGENGEFTWSWDNTLSYGLLWRISNQDEAIVGLAAGGTAYSVNGDDGNQNYGKGIASNAATQPPPADSPNTVTLPGSPPNSLMLF